jgi:hypothetical protein
MHDLPDADDEVGDMCSGADLDDNIFRSPFSLGAKVNVPKVS